MESWSHWIAVAPDWVPTLDRKWFIVRNQGNLLSAGVHLGLCGIFWLLGVWPLVVVNAMVAPMYLGLIALSWRGYPKVAGICSHTEANLHVLACSLLLGEESGFHLYFFTLSLLPLITFTPRERTFQTLFTFVPISFYLIADLWTAPPAWQFELNPVHLNGLYAINVVGAFAMLIAPMLYFYVTSLELERLLEGQRQRNWDLLLNMMPERIAQQLMDKPGIIAHEHGEVSVLFADLAGFTAMSVHTTPDELVQFLNEVFSKFDALSAKHGVEKIKTIGDAYMAAAGLPGTAEAHAEAVSALALDMLDTLDAVRKDRGVDLELRIGIHTGPVLAGVIGKHRFRYDLWGDTVNTASRMESHGLPGRIQVSDSTRAALGESFTVDERGVIDVKGKGPMRTWLLTGAVS